MATPSTSVRRGRLISLWTLSSVPSGRLAARGGHSPIDSNVDHMHMYKLKQHDPVILLRITNAPAIVGTGDSAWARPPALNRRGRWDWQVATAVLPGRALSSALGGCNHAVCLSATDIPD